MPNLTDEQLDQEVSRIMNMSETELRSEFAKDGLDFDKEVEKARTIFMREWAYSKIARTK